VVVVVVAEAEAEAGAAEAVAGSQLPTNLMMPGIPRMPGIFCSLRDAPLTFTENVLLI